METLSAIVSQILIKGQFVVLLPSDPSTIEEWRAAMIAILEAPISRPHLTMLVDRRTGETVSAEFVTHMARFFAEHKEALFHSRTAIVVSDDAAFGMGRMTELKSQLDNADSTIRVFRSYDAAVPWLTTR